MEIHISNVIDNSTQLNSFLERANKRATAKQRAQVYVLNDQNMTLNSTLKTVRNNINRTTSPYIFIENISELSMFQNKVCVVFISVKYTNYSSLFNKVKANYFIK